MSFMPYYINNQLAVRKATSSFSSMLVDHLLEPAAVSRYKFHPQSPNHSIHHGSICAQISDTLFRFHGILYPSSTTFGRGSFHCQQQPLQGQTEHYLPEQQSPYYSWYSIKKRTYLKSMVHHLTANDFLFVQRSLLRFPFR